MGGPGSGTKPEEFDTADAAIEFLWMRAEPGAKLSVSMVNAIHRLIIDYRASERQLDEWVAKRGPRVVRGRVARDTVRTNINGSRTYPMIEGKAPIGS